jgi:hypothetical protein
MPSLTVVPSSPTLFRTYAVRSNQSYNCRIWEAARATTAAPTFFKSISIADSGLKESFIDAGLGCNNPVKHVLREAEIAFGSDRRLACIVSVGTGQKGTVGLPQPDTFQNWIPTNVINVLKEIATTCETAAEEMEESFKNIDNTYFRLSVEQGMQNISLQEWKKLEDVTQYTKAYLKRGSVTRNVDSIVDVLRKRSGVLTIGQVST